MWRDTLQCPSIEEYKTMISESMIIECLFNRNGRSSPIIIGIDASF